jgi:hypothetical protein
MRNKWLNWEPRTDLMEKGTPMAPSKPSELSSEAPANPPGRGSDGFDGTLLGESPIKPTDGRPGDEIAEGSVSSANPKLLGGEKDPYRRAAQAALARMLEHPYPPFALLWASVWHPQAYDYVVSNGPDLIHDLWTKHAPLADFQCALDSVVKTHRQLCEHFIKWKKENAIDLSQSASACQSAGRAFP